MTEEYTPTEIEIKTVFLSGKRDGSDFMNSREFDRALNKIKADAWDEGAKAGLLRADYEYGAIGFEHVRANPYRD